MAGNNGAFCFIQTERSSRGRGFFFIFIKNSPPCRRPPLPPRAAGDAPSAAEQGLGARGAAPAAAGGPDPFAEGEGDSAGRGAGGGGHPIPPSSPTLGQQTLPRVRWPRVHPTLGQQILRRV